MGAFVVPVVFDHMGVASVPEGVTVMCEWCGGRRIYRTSDQPVPLATICGDMMDHYVMNHPRTAETERCGEDGCGKVLVGSVCLVHGDVG